MNTNSIKKCIALLLSIAAGACFAGEPNTVEQKKLVATEIEITKIPRAVVESVIIPYLMGKEVFRFTTSSTLNKEQYKLLSERYKGEMTKQVRQLDDCYRLQLNINTIKLTGDPYFYTGTHPILDPSKTCFEIISQSPKLTYEAVQRQFEVENGALLNRYPLHVDYREPRNKNLIRAKNPNDLNFTKLVFFNSDETSLCLVSCHLVDDRLMITQDGSMTIDLYTREDEPDVDFEYTPSKGSILLGWLYTKAKELFS